MSLLEHQSELLASYLGRLGGLVVCDVGVGQGKLARRLLAAGARSLTAIGLAIDYLRPLDQPAVERLIANAENLPFLEHFDVIAATDILEHILNPGDFLLSAHDALRVGGRLVLRVPYRESLVGYARLAGCPYDFVHLRTFSRRSLVDMIQSVGLTVREVHHDGWMADRLRSFGLPRRLPARAVSRLMRNTGRNPYGGLRIPNGVGKVLMRSLTITVVAIRQSPTSAISRFDRADQQV